jgi:AcrR family transcriptional regulator
MSSRTYRSPHRDEQARRTRERILAAARRLMARSGYANVTVGEIAEDAGVSVPTVYTSVGKKPDLALALIERVNDEVDMETLNAAQQEARTPDELLRANAHLTRVLNEAAGDIMTTLLAAAAVNPDEVGPAAERGRSFHIEGMQRIAERLERDQALRPGLTSAEATAILATLATPEVVEKFVTSHGWGYDRYEAWLADAYSRLLLA